MRQENTRNKTQAENKKGELSRDILKLVGDSAFVADIEQMAAPMLQLLDYFNPENRIERQRIWKAIRYLEAKNRIHVV